MKIFSLPLMFLLFAFTVSAQAAGSAAKPAPTPPDEDEVVRISTELIQLDVSVTDKKGAPLTDLRPDEIEIFENGKKKQITHFSFVPGARLSAEEVKGSRTAEVRAPLLPSGPVRPEAVRRTVAIVVDDLSLSFASTFWVKEALKKFIREQIQEGDLVAIIRTGASMGALQQFTTDRQQLLAAAGRIKWGTLGSGGTSFFSPARSGLHVPNRNADDPDSERYRDTIFASGTIGALNFVVRGMTELPGRKSVILLTDSINIFTRDNAGRPQFSLSYHALRQLIDQANRSAVTFYPIHAEGLSAPGITAEDDFSEFSMIGGESVTDGILSGRLNRVRDIQQGLRFLAEQTGGFAVVNSNDIARGMRQVMHDHSYYLVAYQPDENTFDPKSLRYNRLEVKVSRPRTHVRFRSGFLSVSDEQNKPRRMSTTESLITALTSPFRLSQIDVRLSALFAADEKGDAVVNSFINIDPSGLTFKPAGDGLSKTSFDIVAFTFGADGRVIDQRSKNFTLTVTPTQYDALVKRGLVSVFSLPVKKAGGYQVRLAVHDPENGNLGSASQFVEVPSVKSGKLFLSGMLLSSGQGGQIIADTVAIGENDPLRYTSLRQFTIGSTLQFSYLVYNPRLGPDRKPRIVQSYRLYKDDRLVFTSSAQPVPVEIAPAARAAGVSGGMILGKDLVPGDYILQVDITDEVAKRTATQFAQLEIIQ